MAGRSRGSKRPFRGSRGGGPGRQKRGRPDSVNPPDKKFEETPARDAEEVEEDEEGDGVLVEEPAGTYTTFVQSLLSEPMQLGGGFHAKAYARRQREEQGAISNSSSSSEDGGEGKGEGEAINHSSDESEDASDSNEIEEHGMPNVSNGRLVRTDGKGTDPRELCVEESGMKDREVAEDGEQEDADRVASGKDAGSSTDPFRLHFEHVITEAEIAKLQETQVFSEEFPASGLHGAKWSASASHPVEAVKSLANCGVKLRLQKHWQELHVQAQWGDFVSEQQSQFFALCRSYQDILHSRRLGYPDEKEDLSIMDAYVLHLLNHLIKTKDLVTKNNEKFHHQTSIASKGALVESPRDQGFTRPKVLILLPLRSTALKVISRLLDLAPPSQKASVEHKQRFFDDFGVEEPDPEDGEQERQVTAKPPDFRALFSANNDDHFRIGIKLTRQGIKLYSDFYSSDIIVASPLGLITGIGEAESDQGKDIDFLSSIEILVVDYIDVILMQNWSFVVTIFDHLNKLPSQHRGMDLMRVREWCLDGQARFYRQTILLSPFPHSAVNALYQRSCVNHAGKVKLLSTYSGVLSKVLRQVHQVFERVDCQNFTDLDSARFEFFVKQVFPRIEGELQGGIMVFIPSYFDFVRVRNFLLAQKASFCCLSEYTKQSDISRSRAWFFHGKRKIMLYTERAHFHHRYKIRGIRDLIFYSVPDNAKFYFEILNMFEGVASPSCTVLFSRVDNLQLERIVGSPRSQKMRSSQNRMFMFC